MIELSLEQISTLKSWFFPEQVGSLVGAHVLQTGNGSCVVERWPSPRVLLIETAGNYMLLGEPSAITPADLAQHIRGFVEASGAFVPLLKTAFPDLQAWERIVFA